MKQSGSSSDKMDADLDQDRSGGENRSCGGSRDESPAPSADSGYLCVAGDSEASGSEGYDSSDEKHPAPKRRARHCPVSAVAGEPEFTGHRSSRYNNRSDVGNIGIFFGNWGQRTQKMEGQVQKNIDAQIKKPMPSHWPD